jgi:hypothetical protein
MRFLLERAMKIGLGHSFTLPGRRPRQKGLTAGLAVCLGTAFGPAAVPGASSAATIPVGCCADTACKGTANFTLRIAINHAGDGDTVDMGSLPLACSTITLTGGEIAIPQANLTITGPSDRTVTVSGNNVGRVLYHSGTGVLTLNNFSVANGHTSGYGGCIASLGALSAYNMQIHACSAHRGGCTYSSFYTFLNHGTNVSSCNASGDAGAVLSLGNTTLNASSVSGSTAYAGAGGILAIGNIVSLHGSILDNTAGPVAGGLYAGGHVYLVQSVVRGNKAESCGGIAFSGTYATLTSSTVESNSALTGSGGGICGKTDFGGSPRTVTLNSSTVSNNNAFLTGGGVDIQGRTSSNFPTNLIVSNSTISGNAAGGSGGGIHMFYGVATIHNSTIAFNAAPTGGGLYAGRHSNNGQEFQCSIEPDSSIFAKNGGSTIGADLFFNDCALATPYSDDNVVVSSNQFLSGWITADPRLAPLAYHGGPVQTHALLPGSPAIDAGGNRDNQSTDERGTGYPRIVGAGVDVGAYERQLADDEIFYDGFN